MKINQLKIAAVGAVAVAGLTAACGTAQQAPASEPGRGTVVSVTPVADLAPAEVTARLRAAGIDAAQVRFGVSAQRVVYRTIGTNGEPTTASQLVAFPRNERSDLSVVSWLHGTTVYRGDVASVKEESTDRAAALLFASTGQAVSAPDYLGLGEGPGTHPYGHPEATVSAALDALRAARDVASGQGRTFDERVRVSGFSQGGPATMMFGRALRDGADPAFSLGGLAPIAGPFHLSRFEAAAAEDKIDKAALYLAYFATAWDRMYGLYDSPSQAFRAPYDAQVETLFDGEHQTGEIATALPPVAKDLFTEQFLAEVRNPAGVLRDRLRPLDTTCDWKPEVPVHLFHAAGDRDVDFANSEHCRGQLLAHGAEPRLTDVGAVDHNGSVRVALPQVAREFTPA
ncbi:lipase family protein [Amycolatopsis sp. 195334CR]|uniref:lipase family protein n=1 Tax=Amycolatopsis sp. 195334CR TaxID=2814588 RepID=UPI001A8E89A2|nr:lipase family protein [Amycolatopsis sp. 195334CR]MBN6038152.1 lipase [Amycolatopsis sp. 195334CR]